MIALNKKYLLLFSLLITNNHVVNGFTPEFWKFLEQIFTDHQEEKIREQIAAIQHNLKGLPQNEINEIANNTRIELREIDMSNPDLVSQAFNSGLTLFFRKKVEDEAKFIARRDNIKLSAKNYETIVNIYTKDFLDHLGTLSYITAHDLQPFFGDYRTASVTQLIYNAEAGKPLTYQKPVYHFNNRHSYKPQPVTPAYTTYQSPAPRVPSYNNNNNNNNNESSNRENYAQQHVNFLKEKLAHNNSVPQSDIEKLLSRVYENTTSLYSIPANDLLAHTKQGLAELLDEKLEATRKKLQHLVVNSQKLNDSLETTRNNKIADIQNLQTVDTKFIAGLLGTNSYTGESNIAEDVITNMGIQCPICFEVFKEEHHHGTVNRIIFKAADANKQCGHAVCKTCVSGCNNTCPECRAKIDQQDLAQKMYR